MTERKWTQGKWCVEDDEMPNGPRLMGGGKLLATFGNAEAYLDCIDEWEANATMASAAPDLYEALDRIVFDWDGEPEDMAEARAALTKARG